MPAPSKDPRLSEADAQTVPPQVQLQHERHERGRHPEMGTVSAARGDPDPSQRQGRGDLHRRDLLSLREVPGILLPPSPLKIPQDGWSLRIQRRGGASH